MFRLSRQKKLKPQKGSADFPYTAAEIHAQLILQSVVLLEEIKEVLMILPNDIKNRMNTLNVLGLTNSQNIEELKSAESKFSYLKKEEEYRLNTLRFMKEAFGFFGPKCMLVKFSDFMSIMEKYNLVCGRLSQYIGTISNKKLEDISEVHTKLNNLFYSETWEVNDLSLKYTNLYQEIKSLTAIDTIEGARGLSDRKRSEICRFPFVIEDTGSLIDCFTQQFNLEKKSVIVRTPQGGDKSNHRLFIAAPFKDIKKLLILENDDIVSECSFICSYTPFGVLIYSQWEDKADDVIFQKYEALKNDY